MVAREHKTILYHPKTTQFLGNGQFPPRHCLPRTLSTNTVPPRHFPPRLQVRHFPQNSSPYSLPPPTISPRQLPRPPYLSISSTTFPPLGQFPLHTIIIYSYQSNDDLTAPRANRPNQHTFPTRPDGQNSLFTYLKFKTNSLSSKLFWRISLIISVCG